MKTFARAWENLNGALDSVSSAQKLESIDAVSIGIVVKDMTPAASAFIADAQSNRLTIPAHGYSTGLKCRTFSTGELPGGLSSGVDYYVIVVSVNRIRLASSVGNAEAGVAIDLTTAGTGVHTITPGSLNLRVRLQTTFNGSVWMDLENTEKVFTTSGQHVWIVNNPAFENVRTAISLSSGCHSTELHSVLRFLG